MKIQEPDPNDSFILQEVKIRTWWSLVIADNWSPSSLGLPRMLRADSTNKLPMDEVLFQEMSMNDEIQPVDRENGLWAYHASLASIFALIQDINFILVANNIDRSMTGHVDMVAQRLLEWHDSIPSAMLMNDVNLNTYRTKGHGGSLVALYFGYHYYSIILYFQFLNPSHQEIDKAAIYANRAKHHALAFSRLLHTARNQKDCHVVYLVVAHLTVVASSVLLHSLLFGDVAEVEEARKLLTLNFEALEELTTYWPSVERMKNRLLVFQNRCLREPAADAYVLNKWTVRFLLEHALPFKETFVDDKEDWTDLGFPSAVSRMEA